MHWRTQFGLPWRNRAYAALWGARTISTFGNWITLTALLLYLESTGATGLQVGIMLAARELPFLLGPITGALADRLDPKRLMIICDLSNSIVVLSIAIFLPSFSWLVVLVALSSITTATFLPSGKAAIPRLVPARDLTNANALLGSSTNLSFAIGPVVGALLVAGPGVRTALLVDAGTFLISMLLLLTLPAASGNKKFEEGDANSERGSFASEVRAGIRFVLGHRISLAVATGMFLGVLFAGMDNVALVFLIRGTLNGGEAAVGAAYGLYAVAMILAPLVMIRFSMFSERPEIILITGLSLNGFGLLLTGISPVVSVAILAYAVAGAGNGLENIGVDTLIGRSVPVEKLGRVFGVVYGPIFIAGGAAALIGGVLVDLASPPATFIVSGLGVALVAMLVWKILPANQIRAPHDAGSDTG